MSDLLREFDAERKYPSSESSIQAADSETFDLAALRREAGTVRFDAEWLRVYRAVQPRLVRHFRPRAAGPANLDDMLDEVWEHVIGGIRTFDARGALAGWIFVVARNTIDAIQRRETSHRRREREWGAILAVEVASEPPAASETAYWAAHRWSADEVRALTCHLPERAREFVELRFVQGLDHAEIAARIGITVGSSYVLGSRVKRLLQTGTKSLAPLPESVPTADIPYSSDADLERRANNPGDENRRV